MTEKVKVRLYTRVSTQEQAKKHTSTKDQEVMLRNYCEKQGYSIVGDVYEDNGFSAGSLKRPALQRLLDDLKEGEVVMVTRLDRLSRNTRDGLDLIYNWYAKGIPVIVTQELDIDTSTPEGRFRLELQLSLATLERDKAKARIKDTFRLKKERGEACGGKCALGYKKDDHDHFLVDPEGAEQVRWVFDKFLTTGIVGLSRRAFNQKFNHNYSSDRFKYMLKNRAYIGDNLHEAIIDKETFNQVQEIFAKGTCYVTRKHVYLFSGLVYCGECGRKMAGVTTTTRYKKKSGEVTERQYLTYRCQSEQKEKRYGCFAISDSVLEKRMLALLKKELAKNKVEVHGELEQEEAQQALDEIERLKGRKRRLSDLYLDEMITREKLREEADKLDNEIRELEEKASAPKKISIDTEAFEAYGELTRDQKRIFWRTLVNKMTVYKNGRMRVEFRRK